MCWVALQAPGLRGGGRVRGRCFGAMATGMTKKNPDKKSQQQNTVFMKINLRALRHITSAGIRKRQGAF